MYQSGRCGADGGSRVQVTAVWRGGGRIAAVANSFSASPAQAAANHPRPLPIHADPGSRRMLDALQRTEDLRFSPDGDWLVVAGFALRTLWLARSTVREVDGRPSLHLSDAYEIDCEAFHYPHGLDFLDPATLVVANREGLVVLLRLPAAPIAGARMRLAPLRVLRGAWRARVSSPGSVAVARGWRGGPRLLVCNNYAHTVTSHQLGAAPGYRPLWHGTALAADLDVPDGVAVAPAGPWVAVSNHMTHSVYLYDTRSRFGRRRRADGELHGLQYPHGLRFSADGRHLLVADAGAPEVLVFAAPDGDWSGPRGPAARCRVMDEATFQRGRSNPAEGGPKGLDIDRGMRLVVCTSEHQALVAFALTDLLAMAV